MEKYPFSLGNRYDSKKNYIINLTDTLFFDNLITFKKSYNQSNIFSQNFDMFNRTKRVFTEKAYITGKRQKN